MTILNLTVHLATAEQLDAGVVDIPAGLGRARVLALLNFDDIPIADDLRDRAETLAVMAATMAANMEPIPDRAMIGSGHPALGPFLEQTLIRAGLRPVYAFTRREAVEERQADGSVQKRAVFRHLGFVEPYAPPVAQAVAEMEAGRG